MERILQPPRQLLALRDQVGGAVELDDEAGHEQQIEHDAGKDNHQPMRRPRQALLDDVGQGKTDHRHERGEAERRQHAAEEEQQGDHRRDRNNRLCHVRATSSHAPARPILNRPPDGADGVPRSSGRDL